MNGTPVRCDPCSVEWMPSSPTERCWVCGGESTVRVAPRTTLGRGLPDAALTGGQAS